MNKSNQSKKENQYLERVASVWSDDSVRLINTPTPAAKSTFFYVQEVGYFRTSKPYFTERANLQSFLIVYTLSGQGMLRYEGKQYHMTANQVFFIDCSQYHYYECSDANGWEILWLHFNGNGALGYYELFHRRKSLIPILDDPDFMEHTLRRILTLTARKDMDSELICSNLIMNIVTELLLQNNRETISLSTTPQYLKEIANYLELHFREPLSLCNLSLTFGVSKYHLSREFKRYYKCTFLDYLMVLRLNYAKELLRFSNLSVGEIAFACGMNNVSHFINLFKRREDCTPLSYRKEWNTN